MSFGFGVGDFLAVGQLCWKVYKSCKDSSGSYEELSSEVGALHNVIRETEELLSQQGLTTKQGVKLTTSRQGCEDVLKDLDGLLVKYESLGTNSRRTFDRMGFGMQDMTSIRSRLIANVTMLDAFNNTYVELSSLLSKIATLTLSRSSHARLENKLNSLIAEVRAGKREGSVISTQTFDTAAQSDQETWEALRKELEDIGISPAVINEKRQFIIAWFQEAIAAGKLDEDAPSEYNSSDVSLHASIDLTKGNNGDIAPTREVSSLMIEPPATEQTTIRTSVPSAHRPSRQPAKLSYAQPPSEKANSRLRGTYLLNRLRGRDKQFLEAAMGGDASMMEKLLRKGVDIQTRDEEKCTALHLAAKHEREAAVRLLLFKGADVHAMNEDGKTALQHASGRDNELIIRLLLEKEADVNSVYLHGSPALVSAVTKGYESIVRLLLEKGVDIESKNRDGDTALILAAGSGEEAIVRLLLEKGADVNTKDGIGRTALSLASNKRVEQQLLNAGARR